jgi:hypothetical protein
MNFQILNKKQAELLTKLKIFKDDFYLSGGTAIALHLGHRRSIDFDFFSYANFDNLKIKQKINKINKISAVLIDEKSELTVIVSNVKITFLHYPFKVDSFVFDQNFKTLDLLSLAALKAYALGRRAKWKDYVDLYFILQKHNLKEIVTRAKNIFKKQFNEKNFYQQLSYFQDIDYSEQVDYIEGFEVSENKIKNYLKNVSIDV